MCEIYAANNSQNSLPVPGRATTTIHGASSFGFSDTIGTNLRIYYEMKLPHKTKKEKSQLNFHLKIVASLRGMSSENIYNARTKETLNYQRRKRILRDCRIFVMYRYIL